MFGCLWFPGVSTHRFDRRRPYHYLYQWWRNLGRGKSFIDKVAFLRSGAHFGYGRSLKLWTIACQDRQHERA